jgi:CRP-like cAMP-binding protein
MPLDWLNVPLDTPVSELIARGRRSRAIEALRHRLQGRLAPSPEVRLQLVDLLVEAERSGEAVPILLGLADEFAEDGFVAKAVAVLKRVDALEPGRADVERRLEKLVQQQQEATAEPAQPFLPELEHAPASQRPAGAEVTPVAPAPPLGVPPPVAAAAPAPQPVPDHLPPVSVVAEAAWEEPEARPELEPLPVAPETTRGLRGVVRRFVASLMGEDTTREEGETLPGLPVGVAAAPEAEVAVAEATPEISEEVFQEQLLDLAEQIVHRAPEPAPASPTSARLPPQRRSLALYAERLLASALFAGLSEQELLEVVHGLRLLVFEAGDVVVSEGEKSEGLFIVATGAVKVFVRSPTGRNVAVAELPEGQFFGEIASLSGRPRSATVTAAARTELLVLDGPALQALTTRHPRIGRVIEDSYVERASSPDVAAVRAVRLADQALRRRADEVLAAHFGQSRWDPRMKLRLAELLLRTDKPDDALAVLVGLADDLAREGFPEKAVAVLKKIERIRKRDIEEVSIAPLQPHEQQSPPAPAPAPPALAPQRPRVATDDFFQAWLVDVLRDRVHQVATVEPVRGYQPGLKASPLFDGLAEDELLALVRGLRLLHAEPGDILVSEGEPGESVFILASGRVRVFVAGADARRWPIGVLDAGSFFGEIGALSGRPRSASVVAASPCELLELDGESLERIAASHPRVRAVLEVVGSARSEERARFSKRE